MALLPQRGIKGLDHLKKEFDQYFNHIPFVGADNQMMQVDVHETTTTVVAECDIPGIEEKEHIHVDIINNRQLKVSAVIEKHQEEANKQYDRKERFYGKLDRSITLPKDVSLEETTATYKNGVLKIVMPKTNTNQDSHIDVQFD